ncbi:unnamed protein product [Urochloa humidicola]
MAGDDCVGKKGTAQTAAARRPSRSPAGSVEVSSPPPVPAGSFRCDVGRPCRGCASFNELKAVAERGGSQPRKEVMKTCRSGAASGSDEEVDSNGGERPVARRRSSRGGGGGSAGGSDDSDDSSSTHSSPITPVPSMSVVPSGTEDSFWGSIDHGTRHRCRHGMHVRILKEGQEKKMMWVVILTLAGLLVAAMFGVILKRK